MTARALGKMLVGNILATAAVRFADREAFFCAGTNRRFTFRQTNDRCNRLVHGLLNLGLAKGDVVAFLASNRVEVVEIYFALAKSGLVGIPLNYRLATAEMIDLMRAMGAQALVYEARFLDCATQVERELSAIRHYVAIGERAATRHLDYEALLAGAAPAEPEAVLDEADPYYFNLTSGTTGLPKSYVLSQFNNSAIAPMFLSFDTTRQDVFMTVFPMFGRVGFAWAVGSVIYGVRNVLANFDAGETLRLIEAERVTILNLVATMATMLLASPKLAVSDLSSLRAIVYAGSMLPAPTREQSIARLCKGLYEYYGMQETGVLVVSTPEDRLARPDSVGRVSLFSEIRIVGNDDQPLAVGAIGEILGRSPNAVSEYFQNPGKSAETFRDGWVHTGDLGSIDEDGYLFIRGRKKDMIITGGQNVHAAEVEEAILRHPAVADCAVIGLPDDLWGERVVAVVVAKPEMPVSADALCGFCRDFLAGFKTPKQYIFHGEPLPRTLTGKLQKFLLVDRYAGLPSSSATEGLQPR